jgi:nicotinate-nucleotide adenylyltransferase
VRVGILGGTFDPPHVGHLLAASDASEVLQLNRVLFIPAAQQPFKAPLPGSLTLPNGPVTAERRRAPAPDRLEMVRLAIADDARFELSAIEINRGGLSYTVDTLTELAEQAPGDARYLLVGADVLATLAKWRQPERIFELSTLAVFTRGVGDEGNARAAWDGFCADWRGLHGRAPDHVPIFIESRRIDVSSTEVRERVARGRSIHGFVPDAVATYVAERGLYR